MKRITLHLPGTILLFILFDPLPLVQSRPLQEPKPVVVAVNLNECKPASFHFPRPLGSESLVVKGRRKTKCIVRYTREVEGGYSESECRLPISLGVLRMSDRQDTYLDPGANHFSVEVSKYCKVVKQGNVFMDSIRK
jgi:hypothetical protein